MRPNIWQELFITTKNARNFVAWVLLALIVIFIGFEVYTMIYAVEPNESGVLEFLGKVTDKRIMPGLHFKWPWPLSKVYKVPVKEVKRLVVDDFFQPGEPNSRSAIFYQLTGLESYCLSGDNNAVEIQTVIQYTISDPFNYLYGVSGKETLLRDIVCREIIHLLAVRKVDLILTYGKKEIEQRLRLRVQEKLDHDRSGLSISSVEIRKIKPPSSVQSYFDDVINAQVDKEKMISRAESYYNEEIPAARAEKQRTIKEAEAYRNKVVKSAQGESERFLQKLSEYKKAPEVTRKRLYLEFARETLGQLKNTYLLDKESGKTPATLRILSVD